MKCLDVHRNKRGFTIVELLIVIVVIAILAAISIVAYNGIQNRAHDTAIQSDIANFAKKIRLVEAETGAPPNGGGMYSSGDSTSFPGMRFQPSKQAYDLTTPNLGYCKGVIGGEGLFVITARSKSGNVFKLTSQTNVTNMGKVAHPQLAACSDMDSGFTYSYGYNPQYGWWSWID